MAVIGLVLGGIVAFYSMNIPTSSNPTTVSTQNQFVPPVNKEWEKYSKEYKKSSESYNKALDGGGIETCDKINDPLMNNDCKFAFMSNNLNYFTTGNCQNYFTGDYLVRCMDKVNFYAGICENIVASGSVMQSDCFDNRFYLEANKKIDISICDKIKADNMKQACKRQFSK